MKRQDRVAKWGELLKMMRLSPQGKPYEAFFRKLKVGERIQQNDNWYDYQAAEWKETFKAGGLVTKVAETLNYHRQVEV